MDVPIREKHARDAHSLLPGGEHAQTSEFSNTRRVSRLSPNLLVVAILVSLALAWMRYPALTWSHGNKPSSKCSQRDGTEEFDWNVVVPREKLVWHPCEEKFECAKLSVPLDYSNPSGKKASLALIKVPSKVAPSSESYRGPVLFNPGGPGGSGVLTVRLAGELFQRILGDDYDIIGFDPRGVGLTEPSVAIFNDERERAAWQLKRGPAYNATDDALARAYARAQVMGSLAEARRKEAAQYVSTPMVARDMLSIVRAHGREKLQYWGFRLGEPPLLWTLVRKADTHSPSSYGTVLGITYASMFPDHVERIIVDALWSNNLRDTDKGLDIFYAACANSTDCALHESTPYAVRSRVDAIFASLRRNPIPVSLNGSTDYGLVDYTLVRENVFWWLYSPYQKAPMSAPVLASALAALERGDGRPFWALHKPELKLECDCSPTKPAAALLSWESFYAIACGDGKPVDTDVEGLHAFYDEMAKDSSFAEVWEPRLDCAGWKIQSKEQFHGPFAGNTSFPILLIGNTADPVTPLWSAHKMAAGFSGAVVLTQNSAGHCSLAGASLCVAKYVRDYFREGKLPPADAVCEIEDELFPASSNIKQADLVLNEEERALLNAMRGLTDQFVVSRLH
ncbi:hypothetical protein PUNSTDRAFT_130657 [Punctularia strigosozonata HHB-11173 SS5]|uniref:uncharacterized protein n=1 Tax=Punctularia strigosozonata (strain HHB-11173) TaxID=741275 RepID=UPI00044182DB|nr:uncharacterized protein PUNSTDRAFT_130657 [Punctularia strigosozonata HHB-11173 SS5]EIN12406.1 hypothetical protein PUNSTDRAFT_130657 [Punctularia strigosozonata HHB-11173 SS5]